MTQFHINFVWQRDDSGYRFEKDDRDRQLIVRNGGAQVSYRPLEIDVLYAIFAEVSDPKKLLDFVRLYGPLTKAGQLVETAKKPSTKISRGRKIEITEVHVGDDVDEIVANAVWFKAVLTPNTKMRALKGRLSQQPKPLRIADARLVFERNDLNIEFWPETLLDALRLQLSLALLGTVKLAHCNYCMTPFSVGSGTGRRADAKYCSNEHRVLFNSKKRSVK